MSAPTTTLPAGIEAVELAPAEAAEVLSDFAGLTLEPIEADAERQRLARAGFEVPLASARSAFRDGVKGGAA